MKTAPLPMTVISGYLGAGKTTLINRLLSEDHGQKLLVMVNDFGSINIDEKLLASTEDDTLTLTNGCVCCTMGADLYIAIGKVLDRTPRPDHLIIEASGIADPVKIANAAKAEPDLSYGGIITVVDAQTIETLSTDVMIGAQINGQISAADLIVASKTTVLPQRMNQCIRALSGVELVVANATDSLAPLVLGSHFANPFPPHASGHPDYVSWSFQGNVVLSRTQLDHLLACRPTTMFRFKGIVQGPDETAWIVQVVGNQVEITPTTAREKTTVVAIGVHGNITTEEIKDWWSTCENGAH